MQRDLITDERHIAPKFKFAAYQPRKTVGAAGALAVNNHKATMKSRHLQRDAPGNPLNGQVAFDLRQAFAVKHQSGRPEGDLRMRAGIEKIRRSQYCVKYGATGIDRRRGNLNVDHTTLARLIHRDSPGVHIEPAPLQ